MPELCQLLADPASTHGELCNGLLQAAEVKLVQRVALLALNSEPWFWMRDWRCRRSNGGAGCVRFVSFFVDAVATVAVVIVDSCSCHEDRNASPWEHRGPQ